MTEPAADPPAGIVVVDKAPGWTSHDVVAKARGILRTRKVGHSGTLDPDATGVLVLGVGSATRLLRFLSDLGKSYVGEVVLGTETSTLDASGDVVAVHDMTGVSLADVRRAAAGFVGEVLQVPPMVSARRVGGRRLHELARQGIEVEREARPVTITRCDVTPTAEAGIFRVEVDCSSGTYIRTLAADLGSALGGGAHLRNLRRTAVGPYTLADARPLDQLELLGVAEAWRGRSRVVVDGDVLAAVGHGKVLPAERLGAAGPPPWGVFTPEGRLVAVYEPHRPGEVKPALVLSVGPSH